MSNPKKKHYTELPVVKFKTLYGLPFIDHRRLMWLREKHPDKAAQLESSPLGPTAEAILNMYYRVRN